MLRCRPPLSAASPGPLLTVTSPARLAGRSFPTRRLLLKGAGVRVVSSLPCFWPLCHSRPLRITPNSYYEQPNTPGKWGPGMLHTEGTCKVIVHVSVPFPPDEKNGRRGGKHATQVQPTASEAEHRETSKHSPQTAPGAQNTCAWRPRLLRALASPGGTALEDTQWDWMWGEEWRLSGRASDPERLGAEPRPTLARGTARTPPACPSFLLHATAAATSTLETP